METKGLIIFETLWVPMDISIRSGRSSELVVADMIKYLHNLDEKAPHTKDLKHFFDDTNIIAYTRYSEWWFYQEESSSLYSDACANFKEVVRLTRLM